MSVSNMAPKDRYPGFSSFKTLAPIHYPQRWMRTALIKATLSIDVHAMAPCPEALHFPPGVEFSFVSRFEDGFRYTLLTDHTLRQLQLQDTDSFIVLKKAEVMAEPSAETARQIWTCSRVKIDVSAQLALLDLLDARREVTMTTAIHALQEQDNSVRQILAMVAQGMLMIDLDQPLTPATVVRRPPARQPSNRIETDLRSWISKARA